MTTAPARVPWGWVAQPAWARDAPDGGQHARRQQWPITQQASQQWLWSLEAVCNAHDCCPTLRCVSGGARAADIDAVLAAERPAGGARLIRAAWKRCVSPAAEELCHYDTIDDMAASILPGIVLVMKQKKTSHPVDVAFFGTDTHVFEAKDLPHLVE